MHDAPHHTAALCTLNIAHLCVEFLIRLNHNNIDANSAAVVRMRHIVI